MATVYSGTGTCGGRTARQWRIALTYSTSTSNTAVTVSWTATIQMKSAAQYGVALSCEGKSTTGYITSSSSSWKDVCSVSGSTSYTRTTSAQTKTITASGNGQTVSGYSGADGSLSVSASISVPALTSYAVTYNANTTDAVSNIPSAQTKYYGKSLTLSSATPSRENYNFLKWNTKADGSGTAYAPDASYTGNAALALYAQWELAYLRPVISNLTIGRCNSAGASDDYGAYALVSFDWAVDTNQSGNRISSIVIDYTAGTKSATVSGTAGHCAVVVGGSLSTETAYAVTVRATDTFGGSSYVGTASGVIPAVMFPIDFKHNGKGVAIGKPASRDAFETGWKAYLNKGAVLDNMQSLAVKNTSGTERVIVGINESNQMLFGYGGYSASEGSNYYYGNKIRFNSKTDIQITSPTAGLTSRAYGVNKVLWSGGAYMDETQTATLSEAISAQPNGIVLAWCWYQNGAAQDYDWVYNFIPKYHIASQSGNGIQCDGFGVDGHMAKYIYPTDTSLRGYSYNDVTTEKNGVTFSNASYVLKYVIGV